MSAGDKGMSYIIIFDIDKTNNALRLKVNRYLRKIHAKMLQQSVWEYPELSELKEIANWIKSSGNATILKKKVIR